MTEAVSDKRAELSELEKSAIVLLAVGEDSAAEVLKHMSHAEISRLSAAMTRVANLSKNAVTAVFEEFVDLMSQEASIGVGGETYVRRVLEKALGPAKAERVFGRVMQGDYLSGIEAVQSQDVQVLAEMIKFEHPQILAMIFAHLEPEQAEALIRHLPGDLVQQVIPRLATLDSIPPAALRELNEAIEELLAGQTSQERVTLGGVGNAAKILARMENERVERILHDIERVDETLAKQLADQMFVFEDLLQVDDRNFQILLRGIDQKLLVAALKGTDAAIQDKVFRNLSQRTVEMLRDDMAARGPMRVSEIEEAKREIVAAALALERDGKVILRAGAGEVVS